MNCLPSGNSSRPRAALNPDDLSPREALALYRLKLAAAKREG
jgi:hypothetical protein